MRTRTAVLLAAAAASAASAGIGALTAALMMRDAAERHRRTYRAIAEMVMRRPDYAALDGKVGTRSDFSAELAMRRPDYAALDDEELQQQRHLVLVQGDRS
jgi:hypothetical protein